MSRKDLTEKAKLKIMEQYPKVFETTQRLMEQYPNDSEAEHSARFAALARNDRDLAEQAARLTCHMVMNEEYDRAVREDREIPEALRKAH
jgi:hypothetical protein